MGAEGWWDDWFGKGKKNPGGGGDKNKPIPQPRLPLLSALRYEGSKKWSSVNEDQPSAYSSSDPSTSFSGKKYSSKPSRSSSSSSSDSYRPSFGQSLYNSKPSNKSPFSSSSLSNSSKDKNKYFTNETAVAFGAGAFAMAFLITLGALIKLAFFEEDNTGYRGYVAVPSYDEAVPYSSSKKNSGKQEKSSSKKKGSPSSTISNSNSSTSIPLGWYNQV